MRDYVEHLNMLNDANFLCNSVKRVFKNKEIHELMKLYVEPILHGEKTKFYLSRASSIRIEVLSSIDKTSFTLYLPFSRNYQLFIEVHCEENDQHKDITTSYEINLDDKDTVLLKKTSTIIYKDNVDRPENIEVIINDKVYIDNYLRSEVNQVTKTGLKNNFENKKTLSEVYIDENGRALGRIMTSTNKLDTNNHLQFMYTKSSNFLSTPFNDLINYQLPCRYIMHEATEDEFNNIFNKKRI